MEDARTVYVYFIHAPAVRRVKIGHSRDPDNRFSGFRIGFPVPLVRLGLMPGGAELERSLHKRFASSRREGEWFVTSRTLMAFIKENSQPWLTPREAREKTIREMRLEDERRREAEAAEEAARARRSQQSKPSPKQITAALRRLRDRRKAQLIARVEAKRFIVAENGKVIPADRA